MRGSQGSGLRTQRVQVPKYSRVLGPKTHTLNGFLVLETLLLGDFGPFGEAGLIWEFPKIGVPYFGILMTRILVSRVLY